MVYKDRLKKAMGNLHPQQLADHLGVSLQAVRKVLAGKSRAFDVENHFKACQFLGVDPTWLATGDGDMRSGTVWPLAGISPADFSLLKAEDVQPALDVLNGAISRRKLGELDAKAA